MSEDLIDRLREPLTVTDGIARNRGLKNEAADEIERLSVLADVLDEMLASLTPAEIGMVPVELDAHGRLIDGEVMGIETPVWVDEPEGFVYYQLWRMPDE